MIYIYIHICIYIHQYINGRNVPWRTLEGGSMTEDPPRTRQDETQNQKKNETQNQNEHEIQDQNTDETQNQNQNEHVTQKQNSMQEDCTKRELPPQLAVPFYQVGMHACLSVCLYVCLCLCLYVSMSVFVCVCVSLCLCV